LILSGKQPVSDKTVALLESAERAAGIVPPASVSSVSSVVKSFGTPPANRAELRKAIALIERGLAELKRALGED
jgi:hypothetical protein